MGPGWGGGRRDGFIALMTALRSRKGRRMEKRAAGRAMSRFFWIKWSVLKSTAHPPPPSAFV